VIVVIQCAASKRAGAGHLVSADGRPVDFVADPGAAPTDLGRVRARPDDPCSGAGTWRHALLAYNREPRDNPLGLYPAYRLYENRTYERLADRFGLSKLYILSAGWGLIAAEFLTPYYDITFSQSADNFKRRRKADRYDDFRMLPDDTEEEILFFGGKDYLPLFCSLTRSGGATKTAFYNSAQRPQVNGCTLVRFGTTTRTNWHYECANALLDGDARIPSRPR
jgi:hypothetical protein